MAEPPNHSHREDGESNRANEFACTGPGSLRNDQRPGVDREPPPVHPSRLARLARVGLVCITLLVAAGLFAYWSVPWLGRRGELNRALESVVRSMLNLPIEIGSIDTVPFSHVTITRLRSLNAEEIGRVAISADQISFQYDPIDLFSGRLERVAVSRPRFFFNLDRDLEGLAQVPDLPEPERPPRGSAPAVDPDAYLPITIGETELTHGTLTVRVHDRDLVFRKLHLTVFELGRRSGKRFRLRTETFGATVEVNGAFDLPALDLSALNHENPRNKANGVRVTFRSASIQVRHLDLAKVARAIEADTQRTSSLGPSTEPSPPSPPPFTGVSPPRRRSDASSTPSTHANAGEPAPRSERVNASKLSGFDSALSQLGRLLGLTANESGSIDLDGTITGTWPESLRLTLRTSGQELRASYPGEVDLRSGRGELSVDARIDGSFDRVAFQLTGEGAGRFATSTGERLETLDVLARAVYARDSERSGSVKIEELRIDVADGQLKLSGLLEGLAIQDEKPDSSEPSLDLVLSTSRFPLRSFRRFFPDAVKRRLSGLRASLDLDGRVQGPVHAPTVSGAFEIPIKPINTPDGPAKTSVRGTVDKLRVHAGDTTLAADQLVLEIDDVDLAAWRRALLPDAPSLPSIEAKPSDSSVEESPLQIGAASVALRVDARDVTSSPTGGSGDITATARLSGFDLSRPARSDTDDVWVEIAGADAQVALTTKLGAFDTQQPFTVSVEATVAEFLVGSIGAELAEEPWTLRASGSWRRSDLSRVDRLLVDRFAVSTPLTGNANGFGQLVRPKNRDAFLVNARLRGKQDTIDRAFQVFVREPFEESYEWARDARASGRLRFELQARGPLSAPAVDGAVHLAGVAVHTGALSLSGVNVSVPFANTRALAEGHASVARPGYLRCDQLSAGPLHLNQIDLPFFFRDGVYGLRGTRRFPLFDGTLTVRDLTWNTTTGGGPTGRIAASLDALQLESITRAYAFPIVRGTLAADFHPIRYRSGRLEWRGGLELAAFGGHIRFADLHVSDLFHAYATVELERGEIEGVRLHDLGKTYDFGLLRGVLNGTIDRLQFVGTDLTRFDLDVSTVPTSGVGQFVDRRAIENIRRTIEGPLGVLEETLFSKFHFEHFGFRAQLDGDEFKLSGKEVIDGQEYIMRGRWYQFPRISIINQNPGKTYDWSRIREHLRTDSPPE